MDEANTVLRLAFGGQGIVLDFAGFGLDCLWVWGVLGFAVFGLY